MYTFSEHQHQCRYSREIGCTRRGYAIDALHHRVGASIREDSRSCAAFPGAESRSGTLRGLPPARHAYPNERAWYGCALCRHYSSFILFLLSDTHSRAVPCAGSTCLRVHTSFSDARSRFWCGSFDALPLEFLISQKISWIVVSSNRSS